MTSDAIISVENLGKKYRIRHLQPRATLRDAIMETLAAPFRRAARRFQSRASDPGISTPSSSEDFWALKEVSFEIKRGEVVGIIGRNGAGKSTLLKILSRITDPTEGRVTLNGRVASLLEVGTGFHPELSGRENVYLNGAILGMSRDEIRRKFDEIVAFAEVEKFLDTPVKHYSSGMYVRLAFAVAAHLEPEILIIDEVLAVGDAQFQKKCLGKMKDVSQREGRTVLFVSHNMAAVANLCSQGVLLSKGKMLEMNSAGVIIQRYLQVAGSSLGEVIWPDLKKAPGNERIRLRAVRVKVNDLTTAEVAIDQDFRIEVDYRNMAPGLLLNASFHLLDKMGTEVLATANLPSANLGHDDWFGKPFPGGLFRSVCTMPGNFLNEGAYSLRVAICSGISTIELLTEEILGFQVHDTGSMRKEYGGGWIGVVRPKLAWQTEQLESPATLGGS